MMRMLAWCMTTQSMSSAVMSAWASASLSTLGTLVVANLYTSMPFMAMVSYVPLVTCDGVTVRPLRDGPSLQGYRGRCKGGGEGESGVPGTGEGTGGCGGVGG